MTNRRRIQVHRTLAWAFMAAVVSGMGCASISANSPGEILRNPVLIEALPAITRSSTLGLGGAARRFDAWARDRELPLRLEPKTRRVTDASGETFEVDRDLALVLDRFNQWYGLQAPADHPISPGELETATLRPDSVDRIRAIFEATIARGVRVEGQWITPEAGGEATLDEELRLAEAEDGRWSVVRDLVAVAEHADAVARLVERRPDEVASVDTHGLIKVAVARFRLGVPAGAAEVRRAVRTVAQNAASSYEHDPEAQLALIAGRDWRGRYVGRWHLHPPHDSGDGWSGGAEPSYEDMQNAIADGQYLTVAFQPDGFDLYDASALSATARVDASALRTIRYRSPSWRARFTKLHAQTAATPANRKPS